MYQQHCSRWCHMPHPFIRCSNRDERYGNIWRRRSFDWGDTRRSDDWIKCPARVLYSFNTRYARNDLESDSFSRRSIDHRQLSSRIGANKRPVNYTDLLYTPYQIAWTQVNALNNYFNLDMCVCSRYRVGYGKSIKLPPPHPPPHDAPPPLPPQPPIYVQGRVRINSSWDRLAANNTCVILTDTLPQFSKGSYACETDLN